MKQDSTIYKERLKAIVNTRLIFNTMGELEEFLGNNAIHDNGVRSFTSTPKMRAAYRDLKIEVEEMTNGIIDLDVLMDKYKQTWEFYLNNLSRRSDHFNLSLELLSHFYPPYTYRTESKSRFDIFEQARKEEVNMPLLLMMIMKVLPGYNSKKGDVNDIGQGFEKMMELFENYTCANPYLTQLPGIQQAKDETNKTRLMLIYHVSQILDVYMSYSDVEYVYDTSSEIKANTVNLDIEGLWNKCGGELKSTEFWQIEEALNNGTYFVTHWRKDADKNLTGIRYTLFVIENMKGGLTFYIQHPKAIEERIQGNKYSDSSHVWYIADITDMRPESLLLHRLIQSPAWPASIELTRCKDEKVINIYSKWLDGGCNIIKPLENLEYYFEPSLYAITQTHLYILSEKEGEYYKVPKESNEGFSRIRLDDAVGTMTMGKKVYLAFDELMLYIKTDQKTLQKYGIERVSHIE